MANNEVIPFPGTLRVAATDPAAPAAGAACRYGEITGVALTDEDANGVSTIDISTKVWDLSVTDTETGGIAVGAKLYYDDGDDGLNNTATSNHFFGYALESVGNGATATINVLHVLA
jgi:predicted RecA/RadA family phage recombinase